MPGLRIPLLAPKRANNGFVTRLCPLKFRRNRRRTIHQKVPLTVHPSVLGGIPQLINQLSPEGVRTSTTFPVHMSLFQYGMAVVSPSAKAAHRSSSIWTHSGHMVVDSACAGKIALSTTGFIHTAGAPTANAFNALRRISLSDFTIAPQTVLMTA